MRPGGVVNGLLFHMTQPTSRSIIKAIACSKPRACFRFSRLSSFSGSSLLNQGSLSQVNILF